MHASLHTALCDLCGIDVPVVQTGMGWVAGPRLAAATANAGALGILAAGTMDYDQLVDAIRETKERTDRPFGVNLRADAPDANERVDLLIREQVKVASFALGAEAGPHREAQGRGRGGDPVDRRPATRREGRRMGRGRSARAGR